MEPVRITLIGKPDCHLCDDAQAVVGRVLESLLADGVATELVELNILDDRELAAQYSEEIPVVRIGEKRHSIWHVDPEKFELAVRKAAKPSFFARLGRGAGQ